MDLNFLRPFAENHAIQNVALVIAWSEELSPSAITETLKLRNKFTNIGFPYHVNQEGIRINQDNNIVSNQAFTHGITFCQEDPKITDAGRKISINRQNCTVVISDYTRWEDVFKDAQEYFKIALGLISKIKPIKEITVQYTDIFQWKSDPEEINFSEIFRKNSFVPEKAFSCKNIWHAHNGYIELRRKPIDFSLLNNINVDVGDKGGERIFQILGIHKAILSTPIWNSNGKNDNIIDEIFNDLHEENKVTLKSLLTDALLDKINLST